VAAPLSSWHEPTAALPLRFGSYRGRLAVGTGAVASIVGWTVLPARGGRRAFAAAAGVMTFVVMLIGPALLWLTSVALALWLLVRQRPGISYLVVPIPALAAVAGLVVFGTFVSKLALFSAVAAIAVGCAWAARDIAIRERRRQRALS
jgi:hypothetical protein